MAAVAMLGRRRAAAGLLRVRRGGRRWDGGILPRSFPSRARHGAGLRLPGQGHGAGRAPRGPRHGVGQRQRRVCARSSSGGEGGGLCRAVGAPRCCGGAASAGRPSPPGATASAGRSPL